MVWHAVVLVLAQSAADAHQGVGLLERIAAGGVPLICLVIAAVSTVGTIYQYRRNVVLEQRYSDSLAKMLLEQKDEAARRLAEAKAEAKTASDKVESLMRERAQVERESDATLAAAVRTLERVAAVVERCERALERCERSFERGVAPR